MVKRVKINIGKFIKKTISIACKLTQKEVEEVLNKAEININVNVDSIK